MANPKLKDPLVDRLFEAVLQLRTLEECYRFFEDVCTVGEIKAMAQRFEVAKLLWEGHTYEEIAQRVGASSATISRVRRFLEYGADGYKLVLERLLGARKGLAKAARRASPGTRPSRRRSPKGT
ncbi:MAG: YerC/YecD family TrpR-related protein [Armatimonadota bacterium]|nr:YerC/YecD family TrpR-related protein [Armatimonadota bacterium]MDR5703391.1 YerC/YecD family TrpR-related protein [Armatimonadota bacterium]MDR7434746.1 YerC/YecD family TrpR-related protein [Armatimonadota bacterium]